MTEPITELRGDRYPSVVERIVRTAMHLAAIMALILASILMFGVLRAIDRVGDGIDRLTPEPAATGCPFGEEACGG